MHKMHVHDVIVCILCPRSITTSIDHFKINQCYVTLRLTFQSQMTALHLGVSGRHEETVKYLASKADPSALNAVDGVSI